jgi:uncharacterized protein YidB (DUF937 family)
MGLLDELLRGAIGGAMGQRQAPRPQAGGGMGGAMMALLPVVLAMLAKGQGAAHGASAGMGGMGDILEQFRRAGFGEQAGSWVSTGPNLPISPEAIEKVFGRDGLASIARRAGIDERQASAGMSEMLPEVVDRLTPQGSVPDLGALSTSVDDLQRRLGL